MTTRGRVWRREVSLKRIDDPAALRAGVRTLMDMGAESATLPCTCGTDEIGCPHCNHAAGMQRFAKLLTAGDVDNDGEWICDPYQGWIYEPPAPF